MSLLVSSWEPGAIFVMCLMVLGNAAYLLLCLFRFGPGIPSMLLEYTTMGQPMWR